MRVSWLCVQGQENSLVGEGLSGVQTPHQGADRQKLVRSDASALAQAGPIPSRLDDNSSGQANWTTIWSPGGRGPGMVRVNYFGISEYYHRCRNWITGCAAGCGCATGNSCRTKVRNLRKLGMPLRAAIAVGLSRKGPWHLARTLATNGGMNNEWLKSQGLISIKELWVNIHYPATAR